MFLHAIVRLYDYQYKMNGHILNVAEQVSNEELTSVIIEGQPSIRDTLVHLVYSVQINASGGGGGISAKGSFTRQRGDSLTLLQPIRVEPGHVPCGSHVG